ncbi:hypothetical protein ACJIZ3_011894 [Penstemon smallii]|uniref:Uncharacterized protein n=1 Tax=Penstemon smallii TaxID=265156 RepID=A0ABD3UNY9_9LAMI
MHKLCKPTLSNSTLKANHDLRLTLRFIGTFPSSKSPFQPKTTHLPGSCILTPPPWKVSRLNSLHRRSRP